jgi:DNA repair exonuclease SbcCD ATPase subunit
LAQELEEVRNSKKETIYIDDSSKALAQYKEETETKIKKLKDQVKKVNDEKLEAIKKLREDIHSGYDKEINNKQKQELSLNNAIELAQQKMAEIENQLQPRIAHAEALKNFRHYMNCLAVEASLVYNQDCNDEERKTWLELFRDTRIMLDGCDNALKGTVVSLKIVDKC